ncbi:hypothetical protein CY35_08G025000 [Sphagnum magellanicum]|nr:hypothetical protein CY35_08G025000 [Sphagnum magellanicum]
MAGLALSGRPSILLQARRYSSGSLYGGASLHSGAIERSAVYLNLLRVASSACCCSSASSGMTHKYTHGGRGGGVAVRSSSRWMQTGQQQSSAAAAHEGALHVASGSAQAEVAVDSGITIGQVALQGPREEMEDEVVLESHGPNGFVYAAIFDGHAGFSSAQFLRDELYKECVTALDGGALLESKDLSEAEAALTHAFLHTDKRLLSWLEETQIGPEVDSGSTATVMFIRSDRLLLAHVGDSRAVLSRGGRAVDLCSDHRPYGNSKSSMAEVKRIQAAGGWVSHGRVCGSLSVSRAFGDVPFKSQKKKMIEEGIKHRRWTEAFASTKKLDGEWLVALPDTSHIYVEEDMEFIILASDGLWDSFKSADAVQFIRKKLREHADAQHASEEIAKEALMRNGQDNVSVIVIDFGKVRADGASQNPFGLSKWW